MYQSDIIENVLEIVCSLVQKRHKSYTNAPLLQKRRTKVTWAPQQWNKSAIQLQKRRNKVTKVPHPGCISDIGYRSAT